MRLSFLQRAFCAWVLALALHQFAENTADPDLWGHVLFGEYFVNTGILQKVEPYSWTAPNYVWVNHEVLSEAALGGAHLLLGGAGLLLLKVIMGFMVFGIALHLGREFLNGPWRAVAWGVAAISVVEISFGFSARPQIFTALALAIQLWILRRIHQNKLGWALVLPVLFAGWINTHGGALAGIVLLFIAATSSSLQKIASKNSLLSKWKVLGEGVSGRVLTVLWVSALFSTVAMFLNPWGVELVRWLIESVLWLRPEIDEWNPTRLSWDHGAFFGLLILSAVAFLASRKPRDLWEMAICGALAVIALRSVRHTPLFCIAAMAFIPPHLADAIARMQNRFGQLAEVLRRPMLQKALAIFVLILAVATSVAAFSLHKEKAYTMEVPRGQYPVAAVNFMKEHRLNGNVLVFFDWGEMCIWELPESRISIDGRLDTCYPHSVIAAHWKFYNGKPFDQKALDVSKADLALLPANLAGAFALRKQSGWQPVYYDDLAVVLVRKSEQFSALSGMKLPVEGAKEAASGRAPYPDKPPLRARRE